MQWGKATNMGKMGYGYGSEFHLLRYLGYHRHQLNRAVEEQTSGHIVDGLDFAFGRDGEADSEWKGVDFLDSAPDVKSAWLEFWPQMGNVPNWDAVGRLESNSGIAYLLVEAKAHVEELQSSCKAKDANKQGGLDKIKDALKTTIPQEHSPAFLRVAFRAAQNRALTLQLPGLRIRASGF